MDSSKRRSLAMWTGVAFLLASAWLIVGAIASKLASRLGWGLTIVAGMALLAAGMYILLRLTNRKGPTAT